MKRITFKVFLTAVVMLASALAFSCFSQTVTYKYKPLKDYGCSVSYSVCLIDSTYCIVASVTSASMRFIDNPTMMLKSSDDVVLRLEGINSDDFTKTSGNKNGVYSYILTTALFPATPEQFESLSKGVTKVRLSTFPVEHERTFKKDKIGVKIYELYCSLRDRGDDF